jgi:hypothetical protein
MDFDMAPPKYKVYAYFSYSIIYFTIMEAQMPLYCSEFTGFPKIKPLRAIIYLINIKVIDIYLNNNKELNFPTVICDYSPELSKRIIIKIAEITLLHLLIIVSI